MRFSEIVFYDFYTFLKNKVFFQMSGKVRGHTPRTDLSILEYIKVSPLLLNNATFKNNILTIINKTGSEEIIINLDIDDTGIDYLKIAFDTNRKSAEWEKNDIFLYERYFKTEVIDLFKKEFSELEKYFSEKEEEKSTSEKVKSLFEEFLICAFEELSVTPPPGFPEPNSAVLDLISKILEHIRSKGCNHE